MEEIAAIDELTLEMTTRQPDLLLLNRLLTVLIGRASRAGDGFEGTGPYRPVESPEGLVQGEAFREHWRGRPAIERVSFRHVPDPAEAFRQLRAGEADLIRLDDPEQLADVPGLRKIAHRSLAALCLWLNAEAQATSPLADARVRRAISLALDREDLGRRASGHSFPLGQLVPPGSSGTPRSSRRLPRIARPPASSCARPVMERASI